MFPFRGQFNASVFSSAVGVLFSINWKNTLNGQSVSTRFSLVPSSHRCLLFSHYQALHRITMEGPVIDHNATFEITNVLELCHILGLQATKGS